VLLAACAAAPPVKAQAVITPGAVALLANSTEPSAAQMLRRALVDANPDVRRLAARVVSVTHPEVAGALVAQLRVEQDIDTRAELVRGAMLLGGANALPVVLPEAEKAGPALLALAQWMARNQPAAFAARLDEWSEKVGTDYPDELRDAVVIAARQQPATQVELLPRWMQQAGAGAWFDTLVGVYPTAAATAERDTVLAAALSSARPSITCSWISFMPAGARMRTTSSPYWYRSPVTAVLSAPNSTAGACRMAARTP